MIPSVETPPMDFHNTSLDTFEAQQAADLRHLQSLDTDNCWNDYGFRAFWDEVESLLNERPSLWIWSTDGRWRRFWQRISGKTLQKMLSMPSLTDTIPPRHRLRFLPLILRVWAVDPARPVLPLTQFTQRTMLKGQALLTEVSIRTAQGMNNYDLCISCGYVRENGKPAFTDFYTAIIEARGNTINQSEPEEIKAEDSDYQEQINELLEDYPADAIRAFIELYGEDDLDRFTDSYQGEMSGAEFAEQLVTDCYCLDIPGFVEVD